MLRYIKYFIEQSWLLIVSSFCFGLLLAVANAAWSPQIEQNRVNKLNHSMGSLLKGAEKFEWAADVEIEAPRGGKKSRSIVYKANNAEGNCVGWAFIGVGSGFADKIELVIAVDKNFEKVAGFDVLSSNETPGFGDQIKNDYYRDQFSGAPAGRLELSKMGDEKKIDEQIVAISGATISSSAVVAIFNDYIDQIKNHLQQKGLIGDGGE